MKLRLRIPLLLGITIFLMSAGFYIFVSQALLVETASLERIDIERDIQRVSSSLQGEIDGIMDNNADYATWDAAYQYVHDRNETFLKENFEGASFVNLKLNVVAVFDDKNELIYHRGYDWQNDIVAQLPDNFFSTFSQYPDLLEFHDITKGRWDIIDIDGEPMLVTTRPILTTEQEGPIGGTLLMGRWLDETTVEDISHLTQLDLSIVDTPDEKTVASIEDANLKINVPQKVLIQFISDNKVMASILLRDSKDNPVAVLNINKERPAYLLTINNIRELFIITLVICFLTIMVSLFLLDHMILKKTLNLANTISAFDVNSKEMPHFEIKGKDEISDMARSIEAVFQELASSGIKIRSQSKNIIQERDKLQIILESISEGVLVINDQQKAILSNRHFVKLAKIGEKELLGKNVLDCLHIDEQRDGMSLEQIIKDALEKGKIFNMHDGFSLKSSARAVPISFSVAPLRKSHKIIGAVIILRDITLEHEVDRMKSEFVSVASHQLRTPLTGIRWMVSLLMKKETGDLNPTQIDYLKSVQESNDRMIHLVSDLLDISRIENNPTSMIEKTPEDFRILIKNAIKEQESTAIQRNIRFEVEDIGAPLIVNINKDKMYQVVMNLVSNSIKYSKDGSAIQIGTKIDTGNVIFFIRDNGIGIPEEQQNKIFGKFFRADNAAKITANGTGLGLYFAKQVVEAHNGKIWFVSIPEQGTTFYVALPLNIRATT